MPSFDLTTNVKDIPADFNEATTEFIAKMLQKPAVVVCVNVNAGANLTMGGTSDPTGVLHLTSAASFGPQENKQYTKIISDHLQQQLNIPSSRLVIFFHDAPRSSVGWNGKTLE